MLLKNLFLTFFLVVSFFASLFSQSPRNLTSAIIWDNDNNATNGNQRTVSLAAIEAAFNAARRAEEGQFMLSGSPLGSLTLPSNFLSLSYDAQALFLINAERYCRKDVNYGDGACKGWIFEGLENTIDGVAQTYANLMISTNCSGHECDGGGSTAPFTRISNGMGATCIEFISRGENIASFYTSAASNNMIVVQAVYDWIYDDAPSWGHREACLLQDRNLAGNISYGFDDNHGAVGAEGFIGIGIAGANGGAYYAPFTPKPVWLDRADVVVLNFFDPVPSGCNYSSLPVELLVFDAKPQQNGIELTWTTVSEIGFDGFDIERSEDGVNFRTIDFVVAQAKSQSTKTDYTFLDPSVKPHLVYFYRLRMIDDDGKFKYSPTRSSILRGQKSGIADYRLSPSLTKGTLSVENLAYESRDWTIQLFDISGKLLLNKKIDIEAGAKQDLTLPNNLNSGLYLVRIADAQLAKTEKIVLAN